jgi:hypothetical protein
MSIAPSDEAAAVLLPGECRLNCGPFYEQGKRLICCSGNWLTNWPSFTAMCLKGPVTVFLVGTEVTELNDS